MDDPVPIPNPGETLLYGEDGDPIVVVLHDWYGRLPGLGPFAEALAARRFRVLVPDLYGGWCTTDDETAADLLAQLDARSALAMIDSAIEDARASAPHAKVGVVGFAAGGNLALRHAQAGGSAAVVGYYASVTPDEHGVIPCPVLIHWAEQDHWDAGAEPEAFMSRLREHGTPIVSYTYRGTRHSFANASIPDRVDGSAAARAYVHTARFLDEHLRG